MPLTVKNIKYAETAAAIDLAWMVDEGMADKIEAQGTTEGRNRLRLLINIIKAGSIFDYSLMVLWGAE
jgi:phage gp46-like protein